MNTTGKTVKTWQKTKTPGLYRHSSSGTFYSRIFVNRKEIWTSLHTETKSAAEEKHATLKAGARRNRGEINAAQTGKLTFGQAVTRFFARPPKKKQRRKESTEHYRNQVLASILRDWPDLESTPLRSIKVEDCNDWAKKHADRVSTTRYNAAVTIMRGAFDYGVEQCVILKNPMREVTRVTVDPKRPELPTRPQFLAMLGAMQAAGGRFSRATADFVAGMAFTGLRLDEARNLKWADVDFEKNQVTVRGDDVNGTKNGLVRDVPMIPLARQLLERMRGGYPNTKATDRVFMVGEAQKSLDRAAEKVGARRITHHGLRHMFATVCIESGADIPTVSKWLGHKDGGALALEVYGHLRDEHSQSTAAKVTF